LFNLNELINIWFFYINITDVKIYATVWNFDYECEAMGKENSNQISQVFVL